MSAVYRAKGKQVSYGEAVGIILLENYVPFIPGDVANATTYVYPVRFVRVPGFSVDRIMAHDPSCADDLVQAAVELEREGVRAITGDCGFMALYQREVASRVSVPVFLSSLLQIPFMRSLLPPGKKIGVITANSRSLDDHVLQKTGVVPGDDLVYAGLEDCKHFNEAVFEEKGELDPEIMEREVVGRALDLKRKEPDIALLLLECSLLPPYGRAVQEAVKVPVFDYVTMIDYVFSAVVKKKFEGFM